MFETTDTSKDYFIGAPTWVALCAAALAVVLCLSTLYENVFVPLTQRREAASWRESSCVIQASRLVFHEGIAGRGGVLVAEVTFRYTAEQAEYTSERYAFGNAWWTASRKESLVKDYPAGKQTRCYVNPNHPWDAVLMRDVHLINKNSIGFAFIGLVSLAVCLGLLIHIRAVMRGTKAEDEWWAGFPWFAK